MNKILITIIIWSQGSNYINNNMTQIIRYSITQIKIKVIMIRLQAKIIKQHIKIGIIQ